MYTLAFKKLTICPLTKLMAMLGHGIIQHWVCGSQAVLHHTLMGCEPTTGIAICDPSMKCSCLKTEDVHCCAIGNVLSDKMP